MVEHRRNQNKQDCRHTKINAGAPHRHTPLEQAKRLEDLGKALQIPGNSDDKDERILDLTGPEKDYCHSTEAGMLNA